MEKSADAGCPGSEENIQNMFTEEGIYIRSRSRRQAGDRGLGEFMVGF